MNAITIAAYVLVLGLLVATVMYRRFLGHPSSISPTYRPKVSLFVPVRGLDPEFERHLESLFELDYPDYEVIFATAATEDPAYELLSRICSRHRNRCRIVVSGVSSNCSDKIHNLLACYRESSAESRVFVVVDADIQLHPLLLKRLVTPLEDTGVGAVTGYRWLVATEPSLARTVATMTNATGAVSFWLSNNIWGGTMAIRKDTFERLGVVTVWANALSDDLTLRTLLCRNGLRVVSISDGLAISHQDYTWSTYWEFLVRQLIIARVYTPALWWQVVVFYALAVPVAVYGLIGSIGWALGVWQSAAALQALPLPLLFMLQGWLVIDAAQRTVRRRGDRIGELTVRQMPVYWIGLTVGLLQLAASATRRWIVWRGVRYHMHARDRTEVVRPRSAAHASRSAPRDPSRVAVPDRRAA